MKKIATTEKPEISSHLNEKIDRKKFLAVSAAALGAIAAPGLFADDRKKSRKDDRRDERRDNHRDNHKDNPGNNRHPHHDHHGKKHEDLIMSAHHCVMEAQSCIDHCIELIKHNDNSVIQCLETAQEVLVFCNGLSALASYDSNFLVEYAAVCLKACRACMRECEKHANKHEACRECARACKECADECRKIA